jgi:hypothetical protein
LSPAGELVAEFQFFDQFAAAFLRGIPWLAWKDRFDVRVDGVSRRVWAAFSDQLAVACPWPGQRNRFGNVSV